MHLIIDFTGPRRKVLVMELAGEIESIGKDVTLFASTAMKFSMCAEYICLPEGGIITTKPNNMSYEESAPTFQWRHDSIDHTKES